MAMESGKVGAPGHGGPAGPRDERAASRPGQAGGEARRGEEELLAVELTPAEVLAALLRLDVEAAAAYEAAAERADDDAARQLRGFARDHRRHAGAISRLLGTRGDAERDAAADPAAPLLAGLARVAAGLGPPSLTLALLVNEQLTNLGYEDVLAYAWDEDVERLLAGFRADEERHLRWLSERHGVAPLREPAQQES